MQKSNSAEAQKGFKDWRIQQRQGARIPGAEGPRNQGYEKDKSILLFFVAGLLLNKKGVQKLFLFNRLYLKSSFILVFSHFYFILNSLLDKLIQWNAQQGSQLHSF